MPKVRLMIPWNHDGRKHDPLCKLVDFDFLPPVGCVMLLLDDGGPLNDLKVQSVEWWEHKIVKFEVWLEAADFNSQQATPQGIIDWLGGLGWTDYYKIQSNE